MRFAFPLFLGAALAGACSGGAGGSPALRDGVVLLYDGAETDSTCELAAKSGSDDFCNRDAVRVLDVARDGQHVAVVIGHFKTEVTLFTSDDLGATWKRHDLESAFNAGVEGTTVDSAGGYAVHLAGGKTYLLMTGSHVGAADLDYPFTQIAEVDLAKNKWTALGKVNGPGPVSLGNTSISAFEMLVNYEDSAIGSYDLSELDLGTKKLTEPSFDCGEPSAPLCFGATYLGDATGGFVGYAGTTGANGAEMCRVAVAPSLSSTASLAPTADCVSLANWPAEATGGTLISPLGVLQVYSTADGRAAAVGIQGGAVVGPIDLGAGAVSGLVTLVNHDRYGGNVLVTSNAGAGLVAIPSKTPMRVPVPATPCVDDDCGGGTALLAWALALGNDDYLVFYVLNTSIDGRHDHLYAHVEHAPPAPLGTHGGPTAPRFPGYPSAVAGNALEKTCARYVSCVQGTGLYGVASCIASWLPLQGGTTAKDAVFQQFLATGPTCDDFGKTWPDAYFQATTATCAPGCDGDTLVVGCNQSLMGPVQNGFNCAALGSHCLQSGGVSTCGDTTTPASACNTCDAQGRAVTCTGSVPFIEDCKALGLTCQHPATGPLRCAPPLCTAALTVSCAGTIGSSCNGIGDVPNRQDCSRIEGLACDPNSGGCLPVKDEPCPFGNGVACQDNALLYCEAGGIHYVDCKALGFSGCSPGTASYCTP